ncbi:MAG TPA: hypothetical protein VOA80_00520 [Thermoanaerobaculia bacterium]|nr:hypothetical protein [Thermoanaerobaculia bacterium]
MTGEPVPERATTALPATALPDSVRPAPFAATGGRPFGPRPRRRTRRPAVVAACLALWLLGLAGVLAPARAAGASRSSAGDARGDAPAADDPVVGQVLQMLRGGVTEPVIMAWLEKSGKRPAAVSSGDLVALHQAGASEQLMKWLLQSAGAPSPEPATAAPPAPSAPPAAGSAPPAASSSSAPPAAAAVAPAAAAAAAAPAAAVAAPAAAAPAAAPAPAAKAAPGATVPVRIRFASTPRPALADPEQQPEWWLLCLYLDGRFVACAPAAPILLPPPPRAFRRDFAPGKHVLRLTEERHLRYTRARGYITPARVDPSELPFDLPAGGATQIAIHLGERGPRHPGPVVLSIERDGKEVTRLEPAAPDPEAWPALCEDVPAALPAGAKLPAAARRDLESCVHWLALWPGVEGVPAREEVRAEAARQARQGDGGDE